MVAGALVGTHAHEMMSMTAQLLSQWDDEVSSAEGGPVAISALLAHLLLVLVNGGGATALSDTFGTEAFIAAALASRIPDEFLQDMKARHGTDCGLVQGDVSINMLIRSSMYQARATAFKTTFLQGCPPDCIF